MRGKESSQFALPVVIAPDQLVLVLLLQHFIGCKLYLTLRTQDDANHEMIANQRSQGEEDAMSRMKAVKRPTDAHGLEVEDAGTLPVQRRD